MPAIFSGAEKGPLPEEHGSGYDKIACATNEASLIAPRVIDQNGIFTKQDRVRTCYMLACLAYVNFSAVGNADIRKVFAIRSESSRWRAWGC